jgi:type 1 fimbria pilin
MTSTTQDPSCAGKPAAYIQKYTFQGSLVTPSCVTVETPLTVSGQLHIGFLAEDGTISGAGTVVSDQACSLEIASTSLVSRPTPSGRS